MQKPSPPDFRDWRLWLAITALLAAGTFLPGKLSVTLTPSLDHRVFWLDRSPERVSKGDYVLFRHRELPAGMGVKTPEDVLKIVGCDEGDVLSVDSDRLFFCNGDYLVRAKEVSLKGEPLRHFVFNGTIPRGYVFVMGQHRDSYDSRYFGFIEKKSIRARAYPIF
jgi:signal peptidase I/conjugal transfer pilin signal peptidase TrbI